MPTHDDIRFPVANDVIITFTFKADGAPFDITGYTKTLYVTDADGDEVRTYTDGEFTNLTQADDTLGQATLLVARTHFTTEASYLYRLGAESPSLIYLDYAYGNWSPERLT